MKRYKFLAEKQKLLKSNQLERRVTIFEVKTQLQHPHKNSLNSRIQKTEERGKNKIKKKTLKGLWDNIKSSTIHIMKSQRKKKNLVHKKLEEVMTLQTWEKSIKAHSEGVQRNFIHSKHNQYAENQRQRRIFIEPEKATILYVGTKI